MTEYEIDPYIWFADREVEFLPKHFIISNTPLTQESKQWVLGESGQFEEVYADFENKISKLPKKDVEQYLKESILDFLNKIKFN